MIGPSPRGGLAYRRLMASREPMSPARWRSYPVSVCVDLLHASSQILLWAAFGVAVHLVLGFGAGLLSGNRQAGDVVLAEAIDRYVRVSLLTGLVLAVLLTLGMLLLDGLRCTAVSRALERARRSGADGQEVPHLPDWVAAAPGPFRGFHRVALLVLLIPGPLLTVAVLFGPPGPTPPLLWYAMVALAALIAALVWTVRVLSPAHARRHELLRGHWEAACTEISQRGRSAAQATVAVASVVQQVRALLFNIAGGLGVATIVVVQLVMVIYYPLAGESGTGIDTGPRFQYPEAVDRALGIPLWLALILLGLMVLCAAGATALEIVEDLRVRRALRRALEVEGRGAPSVDSGLLARATVRSVPGAVALLASLAGMAMVAGATLLQMGAPELSLPRSAEILAPLGPVGAWTLLGGAVATVLGIALTTALSVSRAAERELVVERFQLTPPGRLRAVRRALGATRWY